MSRRDRRDGDRRPGERRESQPDDEQQRRTNEPDPQESDSLTALKAILAKVAAVLQPLQLSQDESIRLVEQLYGSVLEMDVKLAGEADDRRKSSVLAHIQNTTVTRSGDKILVEYPAADASPTEQPAPDPPESAAAEATTLEPGAPVAKAPATRTRAAAAPRAEALDAAPPDRPTPESEAFEPDPA